MAKRKKWWILFGVLLLIIGYIVFASTVPVFHLHEPLEETPSSIYIYMDGETYEVKKQDEHMEPLRKALARSFETTLFTMHRTPQMSYKSNCSLEEIEQMKQDGATVIEVAYDSMGERGFDHMYFLLDLPDDDYDQVVNEQKDGTFMAVVYSDIRENGNLYFSSVQNSQYPKQAKTYLEKKIPFS